MKRNSIIIDRNAHKHVQKKKMKIISRNEIMNREWLKNGRSALVNLIKFSPTYVELDIHHIRQFHPILSCVHVVIFLYVDVHAIFLCYCLVFVFSFTLLYHIKHIYRVMPLWLYKQNKICHNIRTHRFIYSFLYNK